jgi:hypothetical protein
LKTRFGRRSRAGAALLEATLIVPALVVMMLNVINLGKYTYAWITLDNAARALLEYRVYTGVVLGFPSSPSVAQMQTVVNGEVASLPNHGSVSWAICRNANGVSLGCEGPGAVYTPPADPVAPSQYTLFSARVSYTFQPVFSITPFTAGSMFRQVNMRSMQ